MSSKKCPNCSSIPDHEEEPKSIDRHRNKLKRIGGGGRYYRGDSLQLSTFNLYICPECGDFFEDGHHFWSDPESTMGLYREEEDWFVLKRLDRETAIELLERVTHRNPVDKQRIKTALKNLRSGI